MSDRNPLLTPSGLPHGAWAFDRVKAEHFVPALETAIATARGRLAKLRGATAVPNFRNTFVILESVAAEAYDVGYVYGNLRAAHGDAEMQALAKVIMPRMVELESDIFLDDLLFQRVRQAYQTLDRSRLSAEDVTLAEKIWRAFRRGGAELSAGGKARLRAIDAELSTLGPQFAENVLKATNGFELVVTDSTRLGGVPAATLEAARQTAHSKGKAGSYVFTLQSPCVTSFLRYADDRDLRQRLWMGYHARAVGGAFDNGDLVKSISKLRYERATLLGYKSHAHFQMEERMAEQPEKVATFLKRLLEKSLAPARKDLAELTAFARQRGQLVGPLMPWDYSYWANKLKEERYQVDLEGMRPYFRLSDVLEGAFGHAGRLYDLSFRRETRLPVYAPGVEVYEVLEATAGDVVGLLYVDFHPRATKAGGAWCTRFMPQWRDEQSVDHRPHVGIVCNFTAPSEGRPSLLTYQEVTTLFHEFGHALHSLLSRCRYRSLSCTNVFRDFVELPSQIMENWLKDAASVGLFARHYESGAPLPSADIERVVASEKFHAAYQMVRQLGFCYLDLAWFGGDPSGVTEVTAFERQALHQTAVLPDIEGTNISCSFEHIFAGGYSAGYYGYKWAEVLDADAFELFKEQGMFDRGVADRFRRSILERGGSEHPMKLYREFRGREPDPDALLRRAGLQ